MAVTGSLAPTIAVSFKAIPTLDNETDSVQMAGSVDGEFHGSDATTDNVKPLRLDDLGSEYFGLGVALRGIDGVLLGTFANPLVTHADSSEVTIVFSEALPQGNNQLGAVVPVSGRVMDENGNMLQVKSLAVLNTSALSANDVFGIVDAVAGCKIRVLDYEVSTGATVSLCFQDGAPTPISHYMLGIRQSGQAAAPGGFLFETASGEELDMLVVTTTTESISVRVSYIEVPVP